MRALRMQRRLRARSRQHSHQVDEGKHADPHHIQEVPEHGKAHQPATVGFDEASLRELHEQRDQPHETESHVQAVRTHQCEE